MEKPELEPGEDFYIGAFWDLSTERQVGMVLGRIPYSRARAYGRRAGLRGAMLDAFWVIIRELDDGYSEWMSQEYKKNRQTDADGDADGAGPRRRRSGR